VVSRRFARAVARALGAGERTR